MGSNGSLPSGKRLLITNWQENHHFPAGQIHYFYGPCSIAM